MGFEKDSKHKNHHDRETKVESVIRERNMLYLRSEEGTERRGETIRD